MILKDCFYSLLETTSDAQGNYVCKVRLNASHEIYQAHFQGNPITPGACIVQMTKELSEEITTKRLQITQIKNLKFIKIIIITSAIFFIYSSLSVNVIVRNDS